MLLVTILATGISAVTFRKKVNFEQKYTLGESISLNPPVFQCTEIATNVEYECKFLEPIDIEDPKQLPTETAILKEINDSVNPQKELFVELHEYLYMDREFSKLPEQLRNTEKLKQIYSDEAPRRFKNFIPKLNRNYLQFHVEVMKSYNGGDWVNGLDFIRQTQSPELVTTSYKILENLTKAIKFLYDIGYSQSDIKRNYYI